MVERNNQMLQEELGTNADAKTVTELAKEISSLWKLEGPLPKNPIVLLLGGFQGSGKTTVLEILHKDLDLIVVSPDEVRHKLFEREWAVDEKFVHTVNATKNSLLENAINSGHHVIVDQLTTPTRIDIAKGMVNRNSQYNLLTVFLNATDAELEKRVGARGKLPGRYKGTVYELKASIKKHGNQDLSLYNLVLDSGKLSPEEIAKSIETKLNTLT